MADFRGLLLCQQERRDEPRCCLCGSRCESDEMVINEDGEEVDVCDACDEAPAGLEVWILAAGSRATSMRGGSSI